MSKISAFFGWDKHPVEEAEVNKVGQAVLTAGEAVVPGASAIVKLVTSLQSSPAPDGTPKTTTTVMTVPAGSTLHTVVVDAGKVLAVVDPNADKQILAAINSIMTRIGFTGLEAEADALIEEELAKFLPPPAAP